MPPWAPSTVRAHACDMLGAPSRRAPDTNPAGSSASTPPSRRTLRPVGSTRVTVAVVPLTSRLPEGPQRACSRTRSPARYSRSPVQPGPDAVGQILGVNVGYHQRRHLLRAIAVDVGADSVRHRLAGVGRAGVLVLPPLLVPHFLRGAGITVTQQVEGRAVGRVDLAAVDRQAS